ncbi:rod shape-determining protein MreD [Altericroceibacterium endophyticum]|uniref:Rod shape-determining protein MreD n=1 Tax=Altericroceibacterium endophyticum TaxID=1808508 RepID=A0A6I4T361_9SPHN|nr:rod shape-determining protein MreD [Altericroceibacterium endophyticum]MXO64543.1 rod shape-determining protein MreD [Altericroceibacterium endophyticum]
MISPINPRARQDRFGRKINRDHSRILALSIPWLTVLIGSLVPLLPIITPVPVVPPLAFITMLAWRLVRPGLLPLWAGVPFGLVDDLFSGQPFGSGILLFSLALIAIEALEMRFPWRSFFQDWLTASVLITAYLLCCWLFSGAIPGHVQLTVIVPQILLSLVLFPVIARMVSVFDRFRLMRVRRVG